MRRTLSRSLQGPQNGAKASTRTGLSGDDGGWRRVSMLASVTVWMDGAFFFSSESSALEKSWNISTWVLELDDLSMPMNADASMHVDCIVDIDNAATKTEAEAVATLIFRFAFMMKLDYMCVGNGCFRSCNFVGWLLYPGNGNDFAKQVRGGR